MSKECSYEQCVVGVEVYSGADNRHMATTARVDPRELLTVIRDLDRRCAELEGQVAQLRRKPSD